MQKKNKNRFDYKLESNFVRELEGFSNNELQVAVAWKREVLSQAAACDGLVYSVNFNGQNSGAQGYTLPLFEN